MIERNARLEKCLCPATGRAVSGPGGDVSVRGDDTQATDVDGPATSDDVTDHGSSVRTATHEDTPTPGDGAPAAGDDVFSRSWPAIACSIFRFGLVNALPWQQ